VADLGPFQLLDASATCDPTARKVTLAVVNRDKDRSHTATIQFTGASTVSAVDVAEVNGAGPQAMNSFEHPEAVSVRDHRLTLSGSRLEYTFPAHSLTVLRFALT
jgi:alpha-N-arabinofuranosidase